MKEVGLETWTSKKKRQEEIQQIRHIKSDFWGGANEEESVKGNRKKSFNQRCQVMDIKRGNHFRKGSIINNVKENEDGENSTRLRKFIINSPGLKEWWGWQPYLKESEVEIKEEAICRKLVQKDKEEKNLVSSDEKAC